LLNQQVNNGAHVATVTQLRTGGQWQPAIGETQDSTMPIYVGRTQNRIWLHHMIGNIKEFIVDKAIYLNECHRLYNLACYIVENTLKLCQRRPSQNTS
jgi:hypothetical protein